MHASPPTVNSLPPCALRAAVALGIVPRFERRRAGAVRGGRARAARGTASRPTRTAHASSYVDHAGAMGAGTAISG